MYEQEIVHTLSRDLPTEELIGRKFFRDLIKWFPEINLADDTPHEKQYWAAYTIVVPSKVDVTDLSNESIKINYFYADSKHHLVLAFSMQDPNNTDLPIKARTLLQNILTQMKAKDE